MIHELIGIENDIVKLPKSTALDTTQIVLSPQQDPFYKENMFKDFGDLGIATKRLVDEFQSKQKLNKEIKTIEDMKRFVSEFPEFKKLSGSASKHVTLMEQLQQQITKRRLLDLSEIEQSIVCHDGYAEDTKKIEKCLNNSEYDLQDLLRLVMLFALRYENEKDFYGNLSKFINLLELRELPDEDIKLVNILLRYGGVQRRSEHVDLFENKELKGRIRKIQPVLFGVTNIYTQHKPLLFRLINDLIDGSLPEEGYPFMDGSTRKGRPTQILVFVVGGITFEEACCVNEINSRLNPGTTILLGSTQILNSKGFLQGLKDFAKKQGSNGDVYQI